MKNYITSQGYCDDPDSEDAHADCSVTISIAAEDQVDPHRLMRALVDTTRDLLDAIHETTECGHTTDEEKTAALAAMFLNPHAAEPDL